MDSDVPTVYVASEQCVNSAFGIYGRLRATSSGCKIMTQDILLKVDCQPSLLSCSIIYIAETSFDLDLRGVVVTALGEDVDFVSRCFFPKLRVNEDPVTGSAHCELAPYWAKKLSRNKLFGKQLSQRTGMVQCEVVGDRGILSGNAVDYMSGIVTIKT